jgi:hypothetical protein
MNATEGKLCVCKPPFCELVAYHVSDPREAQDGTVIAERHFDCVMHGPWFDRGRILPVYNQGQLITSAVDSLCHLSEGSR